MPLQPSFPRSRVCSALCSASTEVALTHIASASSSGAAWTLSFYIKKYIFNISDFIVSWNLSPGLTSLRTHHQDLVDHLLHRAQALLPHALAVGTPQGHDPSLPVTFEVGPFFHDLTHLWGQIKTPSLIYCVFCWYDCDYPSLAMATSANVSNQGSSTRDQRPLVGPHGYCYIYSVLEFCCLGCLPFPLFFQLPATILALCDSMLHCCWCCCFILNSFVWSNANHFELTCNELCYIDKIDNDFEMRAWHSTTSLTTNKR